MCLKTVMNEPVIADNDITVYKLYKENRHKRYFSLYRNMLLDNDKALPYVNIDDVNISKHSFIKNRVHNGYHSFAQKCDAIAFARIWQTRHTMITEACQSHHDGVIIPKFTITLFTAKIPKGTPYYEGNWNDPLYNNRYPSYASSILEKLTIMENYIVEEDE